MLWLERWQALSSKASGSHVYPRFEERSSFCDYNGHYGVSELCDTCSMSQLGLSRASHRMPTAAQIREVAYALPEADDLVVAEITRRTAVVSGLGC